MLSNDSCVVVVPHCAAIERPCERALLQLEERGYVVRRGFSVSAIDQVRNELVSDALNDGFKEIMWIDSDVVFEPDAIDRLRAREQPIVCGLYPKKGARELACNVLPGTTEIIFGVGGGLIELLYAATGFLYTRAAVYREIQKRLGLPTCNQRYGKPVVPFFMPMCIPDPEVEAPNANRYLAEDYAFSERARQCGFRIMADTTIRLQHFGTYAYQWEDAGGSLERFARYHFALPR